LKAINPCNNTFTSGFSKLRKISCEETRDNLNYKEIRLPNKNLSPDPSSCTAAKPNLSPNPHSNSNSNLKNTIVTTESFIKYSNKSNITL